MQRNIRGRFIQLSYCTVSCPMFNKSLALVFEDFMLPAGTLGKSTFHYLCQSIHLVLKDYGKRIA